MAESVTDRHVVAVLRPIVRRTRPAPPCSLASRIDIWRGGRRLACYCRLISTRQRAREWR